MSDVIVKLQELKNIADAVREKTGTTNTMKITEIPTNILNITSGDITPQVFEEENIATGSYQKQVTEKVVIIKAKTIAGGSCFLRNNNIEEAYLPNIETIGGYFMNYCPRLKKVDIGENCTEINGGYFLAYSRELETLILRPNRVITLPNAYHLYLSRIGDYHPDGYDLSEIFKGYMYVPTSVYDDYMALGNNTSWGWFKSKMRKIEDYPEICKKKYEGV